MRKKVILEPSVFLWQTPDQGFLYDSATASFLHFPLTDTGIRSLSSQWEDIDNLYVAHYDDDDEQESAPKTMEELLAEQKARKKAAKANFNFFRRK